MKCLNCNLLKLKLSNNPKILLVKLSSLGDVLHNLPIVWDLRSRLPEAQIDWVVEEGYVHLLQPLLSREGFRGIDRIIPFEKTNPFRVCIDNSQGIIYVYDITKNHGYIWLIDLAKLNLNSFVTPFIIMLSWMANSLEGEIIHCSSILIKDKAVLLNGPSGSGKSSLALYCHLKGFPMIADDVVLYVNKKKSEKRIYI